MAIGNKYDSIKSVLPNTVGNGDQFGQDITGAKNPVTQREQAIEGENRAVDKKKSSVLRNVLKKTLGGKTGKKYTTQPVY